MTYGDYEPEDAWHPDDPVRDLARNLARRIVLVDGLAEPTGVSARSLLGAVQHRYEAARRRRDLTDRQRLRLEQLGADIAHARSRL